MEKYFYVYMMASGQNGTLYIGVTSDLIRQVDEHKNKVEEQSTDKYSIHLLVYYEKHFSVESAMHRKQRLKSWKREWKLMLIERGNPQWLDLYPKIVEW